MAALARLDVQAAPLAGTTPVETVCGVFNDAGHLLDRKIGPQMNEQILYLFPDRSYLIVASGDVQPRIIFEKGRWTGDASLLALTSDGSVRPNRRQHAIRKLLPVLVQTTRGRKLMLIDAESGGQCLTGHASPDQRLSQLVVAYGCMRYRVRKITTAAIPRLKERLMRESWNPDWFRW